MTARADAYDVIRHDAIAGIERHRLQPDRQLAEVSAEVERAVDDYQRLARLGDQVPLGDTSTMVRRVLRSITDLGPLTDLLARSDVEEIFVEGARVTYLDSSGRLRGLAEPTAEEENRQILDRLLAVTDRQLNAKHPMVQARVLDGTARLTAAIPPIADCLSATLRRYTVRDVTLDELVDRDALTKPAAVFLWALVQQRSRIVISGEPGAGKTTLAAAVLAATPPSHCIRCCEEVRELAVPLTHGGYYEVRPAGLDGTGEISLRDLVKFVLAALIVASRPWRGTGRFRNTQRCTSESRRTVMVRASRSNDNGSCWRRRPWTWTGTSGLSTWTGISRRTRVSDARGGNSCSPMLKWARSTACSL